MNIIRKWLGLPQRSPYGPYAGLVEASLVASRECFHSHSLTEETRNIDLDKAPLNELSSALHDCRNCIAFEYPETETGTYFAIEQAEKIESAIKRRFPSQHQRVMRRANEIGMRP